ncbi:MAG: hypothetical protein KDB53_07090 [Planctomycetes bacterium]|nr:hypothetical protein [Planctomycetota bacterium]
MARKSAISATIDDAIGEAKTRIVSETIGALSGTTPIGLLVDELTNRGYGDYVLGMTLDDLVGIRAGGGATAAESKRRGRPSKARAGAATKTTKKRGRRKAFDTRTKESREQLDVSLLEYLQKNGAARTEIIRKEFGITPAQIRQSMKRHVAEGQVSITGERRGTTYHFGKVRKGRGKK